MQPFNKYYAPDWTPEKGSVNKFNGTHALGDRARKLDQGILIVRFELPYNIWCLGCNNHVGQGVRYNAEKKTVGKYYSTPIVNFRMKCHLCDNYIEIQTDPKNTAYVVVSGARKKMEEWNPEDTEVIQLQDPEVKEKLESDPMYKLEHGIEDKKIATNNKHRITELQSLNTTLWSDPYSKSQLLRKKFREEKKKLKSEEEATDKVRDKLSLQIKLLPETISDVIGAKSIEYQHSQVLEKDTLETIAVAPLFRDKNKTKTADSHLARIAKVHTRLKTDPFYCSTPFKAKNSSTSKLNDVRVAPTIPKKQKIIRHNDAHNKSAINLVSYTDSESD